MKIRPLTRRDIRRNLIIKWALYVLMIVVSFVIMTVRLWEAPSALLLIPIAVSISSKERSELVSSLVGMVCGLMLDTACGKTFGFNAFVLLLICMFSSLMFLYLMRQNIVNIIIINSAAVIIQALLDYLFFYAIWGYDDGGFVFVHSFLPSMIFTIIAGPLIFIIVWLINKKFGPQEEYFLEEQSEDIVRI